MENKALGLLGLARRAGKLSLGHDAVKAAVQNGTACLCLLSCDASERLCAEMKRTLEQYESEAKFLKTDFTMDELGHSTGSKKTAVLAVLDRGFAEKITELIWRE